MKSVLIIGGERNSGLGIARKFLSEGWQTVITSRKEEEIKTLATKLREEFATPCYGFKYTPLDALTDTDVLFENIERAGIELDENLSPAEKLKVVQGLMKEGDERAAAIYDTIGAYFGYAIAYYAEFYDIKHVLIMGRVTSGEGGVILLERAQEVLDKEFPELAKQITLHIPDENSRRVGQSVAAASLPKLG